MLMIVAALGAIALALVVLVIATSFIAAMIMTTQNDGPDSRELSSSPGDIGLPFEDVEFTATDGLRLSGWFVVRPKATRAILCVTGGGVNRLQGDASQTFFLLRTLFENGYSVLLYDNRGTGRSQASRMSFGSLESRDVVGAIRFLQQRGYAASRVGVVAFSMGAASAMLALRQASFGALYMDSPLNQLDHALVSVYLRSFRRQLPPIKLIPIAALAFVIRTGAFTVARLLWGMNLSRVPSEQLRSHPVPTLVIHGTGDTTLPSRIGEQVARAAGHLVAAHFPDGVEHVAAVQDQDWYRSTLIGFFRSALGEPMPVETEHQPFAKSVASPVK